MEVPNQSNHTVVESEVGNNTSTNNLLNSTEYVVPSTRQRAQQQQQLLLVKKIAVFNFLSIRFYKVYIIKIETIIFNVYL